MSFHSFRMECWDFMVDNICKIILAIILLIVLLIGFVLALIGVNIDPKSGLALAGIIIVLVSAYVLIFLLFVFYTCGDARTNKKVCGEVCFCCVYCFTCCAFCHYCYDDEDGDLEDGNSDKKIDLYD